MRTCWLLLLAGCFAPRYQNGNLRCPDQQCPSGYHCAADATCWQNGSDPGLPGADLAGITPDLSGSDGPAPPRDGSPPPGDGGIAPPNHLAIPPPLIYPPAAVW